MVSLGRSLYFCIIFLFVLIVMHEIEKENIIVLWPNRANIVVHRMQYKHKHKRKLTKREETSIVTQE